MPGILKRLVPAWSNSSAIWINLTCISNDYGYDKWIEETLKIVSKHKILKDIFNKSFINKISYKLIEKDLNKLKNQVNPDIYNGATLIGLNGISVKSHGNANPLAFSYALRQCHNFITNGLNKQIIKFIKNI